MECPVGLGIDEEYWHALPVNIQRELLAEMGGGGGGGSTNSGGGGGGGGGGSGGAGDGGRDSSCSGGGGGGSSSNTSASYARAASSNNSKREGGAVEVVEVLDDEDGDEDGGGGGSGGDGGKDAHHRHSDHDDDGGGGKMPFRELSTAPYVLSGTSGSTAAAASLASRSSAAESSIGDMEVIDGSEHTRGDGVESADGVLLSRGQPARDGESNGRGGADKMHLDKGRERDRPAGALATAADPAGGNGGDCGGERDSSIKRGAGCGFGAAKATPGGGSASTAAEEDGGPVVAKRQKRTGLWLGTDTGEGWRMSVTQEAEMQECLENWERTADLLMAQAKLLFKDADFPATQKSITGRERGKKRREDDAKKPKVMCRCDADAKLCTVRKEGDNRGRHFWGCKKGPKDAGGCGFFLWADDCAPSELRRYQGIQWMRFKHEDGYEIMKRKGPRQFRSDDIRQGSVGDCWFLSALAVTAERSDLIERVMMLSPGLEQRAKKGLYGIRLFIDGQWRVYPLDDQLPIKRPKGNSKLKDAIYHSGQMWEPAFSKCTNKQIWVPLIEKAYSKAHGCYQAIHGGWVAEALFDLTSFPTEMVMFGHRYWDSEMFWAQLQQYRLMDFLMGASCPLSVEGLVGHHAYSILDVKELTEAVVGRQAKIFDYFNQHATQARKEAKEQGPIVIDSDDDDNDDDGDAAKETRRHAAHHYTQLLHDPPPGMTQEGVLRLVRLRNPWGCREWTGAFSPGSPEWTPKLAELLEGPHSKSTKGDGTFWMPYGDFIRLFSAVDVCKAHKGWYVISSQLEMGGGTWRPSKAVELRVMEKTWLYISLIQPTKRGKSHSDLFYTDLSLLVLVVETDGKRGEIKDTQHLRLSGQAKVSHTEMILDPHCTYLLLPFSLNRMGLCSHAPINVKRDHASREAMLQPLSFTSRVFSVNPVNLRERHYPMIKDPKAPPAPFKDGYMDFMVKRLHQSLYQQGIVSDRRFYNPVEVRHTNIEGVRVRKVENSGACVVIVENNNPFDLYVRVRMIVHAAAHGATASNTRPNAEPEWRVVGPKRQGIVCALGATSDDTQHGIESEGVGTFAMDRLECDDLLPFDDVPRAEIDRASDLYAWQPLNRQ